MTNIHFILAFKRTNISGGNTILYVIVIYHINWNGRIAVENGVRMLSWKRCLEFRKEKMMFLALGEELLTYFLDVTQRTLWVLYLVFFFCKGDKVVGGIKVYSNFPLNNKLFLCLNINFVVCFREYRFSFCCFILVNLLQAAVIVYIYL